MSWVKTSRDYANHYALVQEAIAWWEINHPDKRLNVSRAAEEYAVRLGKPKDYFVLTNKQNPKHVEKTIKDKTPVCPLCGKKLSFKSLTQCTKANPRKYSGVFVCGPVEDEAEWDCAYVAYTVDGLLDVRNALLTGKFDQIKKVEAL